MTASSRRNVVAAGAAIAGVAALGLRQGQAADSGNGFAAASSAKLDGLGPGPRSPGLQAIQALCEITGGGEKVYGIAIRYDAPIDPASLIITGSDDDKATPWNERCVPVWEQAGAKVTRPAGHRDPALIFPVDGQAKLTEQVDGYLAEDGNITFLTFKGVDHMGSARKFFYIKAARDWLFAQVKE